MVQRMMLYFEWSYCQTNCQVEDMEAVWSLNHRYINMIIDCKVALEVAALRSWPRFASYEEDTSLRKREKWAKYDGKRPIMWDMTNVSAYTFTDGALQRGCYSEYYGEPCFKGGIFSQLCGWLGNEDLWGGGVTDSQYHSEAGYLEEQQQFQESDLVKGQIIRFLNLLDRGFRGKMASWKSGRQK